MASRWPLTRMAQQSAFLMCGGSLEPFEKDFWKFVTTIMLPADSYDDAQQYLDMNGVGHFTYYSPVQ